MYITSMIAGPIMAEQTNNKKDTQDVQQDKPNTQDAGTKDIGREGQVVPPAEDDGGADLDMRDLDHPDLSADSFEASTPVSGDNVELTVGLSGLSNAPRDEAGNPDILPNDDLDGISGESPDALGDFARDGAPSDNQAVDSEGASSQAVSSRGMQETVEGSDVDTQTVVTTSDDNDAAIDAEGTGSEASDPLSTEPATLTPLSQTSPNLSFASNAVGDDSRQEASTSSTTETTEIADVPDDSDDTTPNTETNNDTGDDTQDDDGLGDGGGDPSGGDDTGDDTDIGDDTSGDDNVDSNLVRLDELLSQNGHMAIDYGGSGSNFTTMGQFEDGQALRFRNGGDDPLTITVKAYGGDYAESFELPVNSEFFLIAPDPDATYILTDEDGNKFTKASNNGNFSNGRLLDPDSIYTDLEISDAMSETFVIQRGDGDVVIDDFGGVGPGGSGDAEMVAVHDTLKLEGDGLTAENMLLRYEDGDTVITFEGVDDVSITLADFDVTNLDNLRSVQAHNILFDGQETGTDAYDVFNTYTSGQNHIWNKNSVTHLNNADNTVSGRNGSDDVINAMEGDDTIRGLSGDDILRGQAGDDTLVGGDGDDILSGGDGSDRAIFSGDSGDYTLTQNDDGTVNIEDTVDGRDGADTLDNIEIVDFNDGSFQLADLLADDSSTDNDDDGTDAPVMGDDDQDNDDDQDDSDDQGNGNNGNGNNNGNKGHGNNTDGVDNDNPGKGKGGPNADKDTDSPDETEGGLGNQGDDTPGASRSQMADADDGGIEMAALDDAGGTNGWIGDAEGDAVGELVDGAADWVSEVENEKKPGDSDVDDDDFDSQDGDVNDLDIGADDDAPDMDYVSNA